MLSAVAYSLLGKGLLAVVTLQSLGDGAVMMTLDIMVAIHEQALHMAAVGQSVLGENLEPRLSHQPHLALQTRIGHIAGYQHGIHLAVAEVPEGALQHRQITLQAYVNVTQDAHPQAWSTHASGSLGKCLQVKAHGASQQRAASQEVSSVHIISCRLLKNQSNDA